WAAPATTIPRTIARVVCTLRLTIETFEPTSALTRVDLPAFGAPISATKPQRVSAIRVDTLARQHGGGGRLFGRAFGAADPLRRRKLRNIDRDTEFRIVMGPLALDLAIARRRETSPLRPFLQHR